jgi:hypothetical protein
MDGGGEMKEFLEETVGNSGGGRMDPCPWLGENLFSFQFRLYPCMDSNKNLLKQYPQLLCCFGQAASLVYPSVEARPPWNDAC